MRKNLSKDQLKGQKGFTIIELLVVIVIIGILVALALPNLFSAQARGRDTDRKNELKNLQQKLETSFNDDGHYPLTANLATDLDITGTEETTGPRNDAYTYTGTGTCDTAGCSSFTLSAALENTEDPDAGAGGAYVLNSVN
ncbi:MAG TPA: prepilin-type N-terminal cleavage/methylation domain-containing protein [Candidatus Limnocylindria bacterium]|nr:prepilin-type N-terminal cleavage/methylation domain-containing protein [Candidatus Limnocylindria bacterium]